MRIVFSARAQRDLHQLKACIARESYASRAKSYFDRLLNTCESLSTFPRRGMAHDDVLPGLRTIVFEGRTIIAYSVSGDTIRIQAVFHGGQNWKERLQEG
ncbi:MAG: type II toxin-antitoxin system RelE/ParE family toxin [Pseudomonadota bacterium]